MELITEVDLNRFETHDFACSEIPESDKVLKRVAPFSGIVHHLLHHLGVAPAIASYRTCAPLVAP